MPERALQSTELMRHGRNFGLRETWQPSRREATPNLLIAKKMVEELLARTSLEMGHIASALDIVRDILANLKTADATRDAAADMISLINEAMVRLRDDLDMRQARDDASNVVQFKRPRAFECRA